jgi:sensor histidine kinase YesM
MTNWIYNTPDYMNADKPRSAVWIILGLVALALLLAVGSFLVVGNKVEPIYLTVFFWIINVVVLIWFGNRAISAWLDKRFPWGEYVSKRFFTQLAFSGIYSLMIINLTYYLYRLIFTEGSPDIDQYAVMNIYGLLFVLPAISIHFGVYFMQQWKKSKLREEQLEKERIRTQLEALKSQLDPHFLFNNLNILSGLIGKDEQAARSFLESFSEVYRYVLQFKKEEMVPLAEELEFLDSYLNLLNVRFKDALVIHKDLNPSEPYLILPQALQILIENVIKHNALSPEEPLELEISQEGDFIVIRNNLQAKSSEVHSLGTGLDNIRKRLKYLSDKELEVLDIDSHFIVKLPLLKLE